LADMRASGILLQQEPLEQRVGTCWRCKTPIEIMSERQWFVKICPDEIMKAAREVAWSPEHMFLRMENWVEQMEWDWCISRQRLFATPIPVWSCTQCGEMIVPDEADLPIDPTRDRPKVRCPKCGSTEFSGEADVLDTWMDSSISVLNVTGWTGEGVPPLFPAELRPQGHDIIRTWAFYTILRAVALTGKRPWDRILVNGMVLGEDGFKMSKSRGNIISPEEIVEKHGADALRQWGAAGATTGSDIMFNWNDVVAASRFQTKLWNIARFALLQLERKPFDPEAPITAMADRWLMVRLGDTVTEVTSAMDACQFDRALKAIREFAWDILADNYIELVKGRLYADDSSRDGACRALSTALDTLCRLVAPFTPHFAEECYSYLRKGSVHASSWPVMENEDSEARNDGDLLVKVVSELRRYKHEKGMALNAPMGRLAVYSSPVHDDGGDAARALNACEVLWHADPPNLEKVPGDVQFNMAIVGKTLRKEAPAFMKAIRALTPEEQQDPPESVDIGEKRVPVPPGSFSLQYHYLEAGEKVDLLTLDDVTVTIHPTS
ncbi:MAG: class I tRNA ligase family protein, partial [Methanolinea sp.]|nr:class I tRNA ligase family protein [Methanolinea sp.]